MTITPAGWYPDPEDASRSRWWDGTRWTDHRSESNAATPYSATAAATSLQAPAGTQTNTLWIWLIVLLPLVPMLGLFAVDWASMLDINDPSGMSSLAMFTNPGYLLALFGGWIGYGLCAWFAYLDWRELGRRGVPRPFHFAWVFLSSVVYVIGRSVVARRRTGHGIAPMWAAIATLVVSFGLAIYVMAVMFSTIFDQVAEMGYS